MDVAKSMQQWRERSPEQWVRSANRFAPQALTGVLILLITYQLAQITWTVVPGESFDRPAPIVAVPRSPGPAAGAGGDFAALIDSHLFGEAPAEAPSVVPVQTEVEAPDTTLSLRLTGVIEDKEGEAGQAIIASGRSQEKKYVVGQPIEGANGATLHAVYSDRVILNRSGQLETLRLPKDAPQGGARVAGRPSPLPPPPAPAAEPSLRNVISDNASELTNVMRMAPHVEGGQMVGFRVNPGRDRETFEALGLMPGDVVTDINGMVLDDPARGLQVFEALGESTMANVTILRDGVPTVIVIDTTQLQNIADDRQ